MISANKVSPPEGEVQVSLEIEIERIDTLEQSYFANLSFSLKYADGQTSRTVSTLETWPSSDGEGSDNVWLPQIAAWNEFASTESEFRINQALPAGERIMRVSRSMSGNYFMQFEDFPFDEQSLEFCLMLDPGPKYVLKSVCVYDLETEFEIVGIKDEHLHRARLGALSKSDSSIFLDMFRVTIQVKRHANFYLLNFFSVTFALVLLQCLSIGVDIDDLFNRLQLTLTLILTLAAHKISVAGQVPKNTQQTLLDQQATLAFAFLGAAAVESLLISFEVLDDPVMEVMDLNFHIVFALVWTALNAYIIFYKSRRSSRTPRQPFAYFGYVGGIASHSERASMYRRVREDDREGSRTLWVREDTGEQRMTHYETF